MPLSMTGRNLLTLHADTEGGNRGGGVMRGEGGNGWERIQI